jgi:hypothetical protein
MQQEKLCIMMMVTLFTMVGCLPVADERPLALEESQPPVLLEVVPTSPRDLVIHFDKPCTIEQDALLISPELGVETVNTKENTIIVTLTDSQVLGEEYFIEAVAVDEHENSMSFITRFYGYNPHVPDLLINEFTTQGSGNHPDLVELYITSEGNMAGVTIFEGAQENWDDKLVFPNLAVSKGDYLLVHFKPEGIEAEVNETEDTTASGGKDASDNAYDFWVDGGAGLSGNNGVLTVYTTPRGDIVDAVLYSNRTSSSDENYRGFGTKRAMLWADELAEDKGWDYAGELIAPEDGINPDDSTATRSMCRGSTPVDTDTKHDWHIVPTSTFTFGEKNSDEVYSE